MSVLVDVRTEKMVAVRNGFDENLANHGEDDFLMRAGYFWMQDWLHAMHCKTVCRGIREQFGMVALQRPSTKQEN